MRNNDSTQMRLHHVLRPLLLTLLVLSPGVGWAQESTSQTFDNLIVETEGVENTDWTWNATEKIFTVLTSTPATFSSNGTFTGQVRISENVAEANITIGSLTIDRGEVWASGGSAGLYIGQNSTATVTLQEDAAATIRGAWEQESMTVSEGASVTITGTGSLTVNSGHPQGAGHGAAIYLPKTATMTVNSGNLTARSYKHSNGEGAAIGGKQYDHETGCGTLIINGGEVTLISEGKAAAFGGGSSCYYTGTKDGGDSGTLIVNGGTLNAQGRIGGGASYESGNVGCGGSITINGGKVTTTLDLGSASGATSSGSITLAGGTLTTPSMTMEDGKITITSSTTLADDFTTTLPVTVNSDVVLTVAEGIEFNVDDSNITLADGATLNNLNVPSLNNGYYEIYTVTQLKWFRDLVNGTLTDGTAQNQGANGKLMADIDLGYEAWTPIGNTNAEDVSTDTKSYQGTFDGNNHTVSNLYVTNQIYYGFFGGAKNSAIKNLGIVNAKFYASCSKAGVIAGIAYNETIQNCWSSGEIELPSSETAYKVSGIANADGGTVTNCHTSYDVVITETSSNATTKTGCTANISTDAYKTGELAYLLNTNKADGETGWGQVIGTDAHPVALIEGSNNVYKYGTAQDATTLTINVDQSYNRTTTLCFPKEVSLPDKVKAFTVTELKTNSGATYLGTAVMSELETRTVPANTPVILMNTGTEAATVQLPSVSCTYSNNASESTIVAKEGNLLKGTYSSMNLSSGTQGYFERSTFSSWGSRTLPAYQCYLELESEMYYCGLSTDKPVGEIEYAVLSEEDKTCYVSHLFYAGIGTSDYKVTIPSTTQIDGTDYQVVQFGLCNDDNADKIHFVNMDGSGQYTLYINLPKTIKTVSKQSIPRFSRDAGVMLLESAGRTCARFSTEEAPVFKGSIVDDGYSSYYGYYTQIEVPYAAEDVYKAAWGEGDLTVTSRKTEVSIADGYVHISGNQYSRDGANYADINGTLVINGTSDTNYVLIDNSGTTDEPLRIAINGLSIDQSEVGDAELPAMNLYSNANVSLIVQGDNTFKNSNSVPSIDIVDGGSLVVNPLSTGTLNLSGGISGDGIAVAAKVYSGSSDYTTQNVTASTIIDTDNNQLAFSNYDLVTGVDNFVVNGTCTKFILNDAVDVYAPSDFKANEISYRRTFEDNDFNSLYLPFGTSVDDFQDCEFYIINMFHQNDTDGDGVLDNITLEVSKVPAGSILLPNHPYLFKYKGATIGTPVEFSLTDIDVKATESATFECSSMSYKYEFTGNYQGKTAADYADYYVIGIDSETGKTALVHPTEQLPAMRWAMKMTERESQLGTTLPTAPARVPIVISGDGNLTGISSVKAEAEGNAYYGINGVRKSQMTKGLNIVKTADGRVVKVLKR